MSIAQSCLALCRNKLGWSNSRQSWEERLSGLVLAVGVVALLMWGHALPLVVQALFWAGLAVTAAYVFRRGWLRLFGPVLFYDMIRQARRLRYFLLRVGYAGVLIFFLFMTFLEYQPRWGQTLATHQYYLRMAEAYFYQFIIIQLVAVVALTPAYVGGSIADEKERKTLEFMLATDLRNREIVLSKLVSRLANLSLIVLTGLPILSILQFLGGIDPNLLLTGYAATFLTMFGLAGFSIFASVHFKKPRDAIAFSYLLPIVYTLAGIASMILKSSGWRWLTYPIGWEDFSLSAEDILDGLNSGNLLLALIKVARGLGTGQMGYVIESTLRDYAIFHLLVGGICITWAVLRLRVVALAQTYETQKKARRSFKVRPEVWDDSLLWKEIFVDDRPRGSWMARWIVFGVFAAIFIFTIMHLMETASNGNRWKDEVAGWTAVFGTVLSCLIILGAAVRASTCISGERDKDTFDFLLTTPLRSETILWAKYMGCMLSMRRLLIWLGLIWGLAILAGGMLILGIIPVMITLLVYTSAFVMIGLWFSATAKSSMRATVFTILTILGLSVGHWLLTGCLAAMTGGGGRDLETLYKFQTGMTPPFVIGFMHYLSHALTERNFDHHAVEFLIACLVGLFFYFAFSFVFWAGVLVPRFRQITRRDKLNRQYESIAEEDSAAD